MLAGCTKPGAWNNTTSHHKACSDTASFGRKSQRGGKKSNSRPLTDVCRNSSIHLKFIPSNYEFNNSYNVRCVFIKKWLR